MRVIAVLATVMTIVQATAAAATAQARQIEIPGIPACTTCTIEMLKIATIGATGAPGAPVLLGDWSHIGRGPLNTFVAASYDGTQLFVFDSAGSYVRAVGRGGPGGAEFRPDPLGLGSADTLYVRSAGQLIVYSPQFEFVRSVVLPPGLHMSLTPLPDGGLLFTSDRTTSTVPTLNLVSLLDAAGSTTSTFGIEGADDPTTCIRCFSLGVTLDSGKRSMLVSNPNRYLVQRLDLSGKSQVSATVINSPWMREWTRDPEPGSTYFVPPPPTIARAVPASANRIWVLAHVASVNWTAGPPEGKGILAFRLKTGGMSYGYGMNTEGSRDRLVKMARNTATVLELIDLDRGQVIASKSFDATKYESVGGEIFSVRRIDRDGITTFDIFRLQFRER